MKKDQALEKMRKSIVCAFDPKLLPPSERKNYARYKIFPIGLLVKADWNYKREDALISQRLSENLKRNGQVENILVRELETGYFEVVNGNHRLDAMHEIGREFVFAYDCGKISADEAVRLAIETNETRFEANDKILTQRLNEIAQAFSFDDLALTLPYSDDSLHELLSTYDGEDKELTEMVQNGETEFRTIMLHVPISTYEAWRNWQEVCLRVRGDAYASQEKCFELAIVEANNIPEESLK